MVRWSRQPSKPVSGRGVTAMACGMIGIAALLSVILSPASVVLGITGIVLGRKARRDPSANQSQAAAAILIGWACLGLTGLAVTMVGTIAMLMVGTGTR